MWKDTHLSICIQALDDKGKKVGDSILKPSDYQNVAKPEEGQDGEEKNEKKEDSVKEASVKNDEAEEEKKEEIVVDEKPDQTENNDKTENQENSEKPNETEKENNSNASQTEKQGIAKSESEYSETTKKTKTIVDGANIELKAEGVTDNLEKSRPTVLFEEEAYLAENRVNYIEVDTFISILKIFFDENEDLMVLDHLHEYDDEITEAFLAATDINYDPFLEKLKKTLEQYENTLIKADFKDSKEREATENIVRDIKDQIAKITQSRLQTTDSERVNKKKPLSLEDLRKRGLKDLFSFYSKQHLPEGLEFGDIMNKMEALDLGEF